MSIKGKTYSLFGSGANTDHYYRTIRQLTDLFQEACSDKEELLRHVQRAGRDRSLLKRLRSNQIHKPLISYINTTLKEALPVYTTGVKQHLKTLPLSRKFDDVLKTKEYQYHLYMIEIELVNRLYRRAFNDSAYRFALIAHCLRDFRPECRALSGVYESECRGCTRDCFIHLGSALLKKYGIHSFISVSMDLDKLFKKIKSDHQSAGALGIACVPELVQGMRLCVKLGIPPVGIPLDANRCARWMGQCRESSFNLKELEELITINK
ncbi:MAG: DUF116 domain-containing protein [Nitrospiraceae bacterium]|nr:MAG: DUF116 domain-containing protein [Nitrospiraceae bacterium]